MKKLPIILAAMLLAGCASSGMHGAAWSSGGGSMDRGTSPAVSPSFDRLDSSFNPYFGG